MFDLIMILQGEFGHWSLAGLKGLNTFISLFKFKLLGLILLQYYMYTALLK